jgi:hypothetical protein
MNVGIHLPGLLEVMIEGEDKERLSVVRGGKTLHR